MDSTRKTLLVRAAVTAGTLASMFWGLAFDRTCRVAGKPKRISGLKINPSPRSHILGNQNHPPGIGTIFCQPVVCGVLLTIFLHPCGRFDAAVPLHRWARRYAFTVGLQTVLVELRLLLLAACPAEDIFYLVFKCIQAMWLFVYFLSQVVLGYVTLLRLQVVAPGGATVRSSRLFKVVLLSTGVTLLAFILYSLTYDVMPTVFLALLSTVTFLAYVAFQGNALVIFARIAADARAEVRHANVGAEASAVATRALKMVMFLASSTVTRILFAFAVYLFFLQNNEQFITIKGLGIDPWWAIEVSMVLDIPFNATLMLLCAGLVGPTGDRRLELEEATLLALSWRERLTMEKIQRIYGSNTAQAATIAALIGGRAVEVYVKRASARFRGVSWDVLKDLPEIVVGGGTLGDIGPGKKDLSLLAEKRPLGACDCFISHSWRDDAYAKWKALSEWCEMFRAKHGRPPVLWLDKLCIDQANIDVDLECLPVFLVGCDKLLLLVGETYTTRLWCILELFVYVFSQQGEQDLSLDVCVGLEVIPLAARTAQGDELVSSSHFFDAAQAQCADLNDKEKILSIIARYEGGIEGFNAVVNPLMHSISQTISSVTSGAIDIHLEGVLKNATQVSNSITIKEVDDEDEDYDIHCDL